MFVGKYGKETNPIRKEIVIIKTGRYFFILF